MSVSQLNRIEGGRFSACPGLRLSKAPAAVGQRQMAQLWTAFLRMTEFDLAGAWSTFPEAAADGCHGPIRKPYLHRYSPNKVSVLGVFFKALQVVRS